MILASAAYNAGRFAVMKLESNPKYDSIPINRETEKYIGSMLRVWEALKKERALFPKTSHGCYGFNLASVFNSNNRYIIPDSCRIYEFVH